MTVSTTFAEQAQALSHANLQAAIDNCQRGLETTPDLQQWAALAGKLAACEAEQKMRAAKSRPVMYYLDNASSDEMRRETEASR